jgi:hypothetical protein
MTPNPNNPDPNTNNPPGTGKGSTDAKNPNRSNDPMESKDTPRRDETRPTAEPLPANPTLPRYGDTEPGDPRKTEANAKRPLGTSSETEQTGESQE